MKITPRDVGEPIVLQPSQRELDLLHVGLNELTSCVDDDRETSMGADRRTLCFPGDRVNEIWWALHRAEQRSPLPDV